MTEVRNFALKPDCRVEGCERARAKRSSLCSMHLARKRRTGEVGGPEAKFIKGDDEARFWSKVKRHEGRHPDRCWLWIARTDRDGYGVFSVVGHKSTRAHRFAYELLVGPIPEGMTLDHLCKVRNCVNPSHLDPVSSGENALRGEGPAAVNARSTHCKWGHAFDEANTYYYPSGRRGCRKCASRAQMEYAARKAAAS